MLLRRITKHVKDQNWFAVGLDFFIVVVGVLIAFQITNWSVAREEAARREQIIEALVTSLNDTHRAGEFQAEEIEKGLFDWELAFANGEQPPPFYHRFSGSDTAPDFWSPLEQMQLTDIFDTTTLFDLVFFFSELEGLGQKYIRYVAFVEDTVLPGIIDEGDAFYSVSGKLKPEFRANMDRLREYQQDTLILVMWSDCLVYRLNAKQTFEQSCRRAGYHLEGMVAPSGTSDTAP